MAIEKISVRQVKAARALLDWSQADLAAASGLGVATIARTEAAEGFLEGRGKAPGMIRAALERAGVTFTNGHEPGVSLKA